MSTMIELGTTKALDLIAYGRAPRQRGGRLNLRVVCADGWACSVQASSWHYANDSGDGEAPYWRGLDAEPVYPFVSFEIGGIDDGDMSLLDEWDSDGVWAWVPRENVAALLDSHGGVVRWEGPR